MARIESRGHVPSGGHPLHGPHKKDDRDFQLEKKPKPKPSPESEVKRLIKYLDDHITSKKQPVNRDGLKKELSHLLTLYPFGSKERNVINEQIHKLDDKNFKDYNSIERELQKLIHLKE